MAPHPDALHEVQALPVTGARGPSQKSATVRISGSITVDVGAGSIKPSNR